MIFRYAFLKNWKPAIKVRNTLINNKRFGQPPDGSLSIIDAKQLGNFYCGPNTTRTTSRPETTTNTVSVATKDQIVPTVMPTDDTEFLEPTELPTDDTDHTEEPLSYRRII